MNIKKRFKRYLSVFLILGTLLVFLVSIVITSYAEDLSGTNDGNKQNKLLKCTLPLKDYENNTIPFVCEKKCNGSIDCQSHIHLEFKNATILSSGEVDKFIINNELVKLPKKFVEADESNKSVAVTFSSKVAFDGTDLYVETGTELMADRYVSVKIDNSLQENNSIVMQKRKVQYLIELKIPDEMKNPELFKKGLDAQIRTKYSVKPVALTWNIEKQKHTFLFMEGEEFELQILFDDRRFCTQSTPYSSWVPQTDGTMEGQCRVDFSLFKLEITLTGEDRKRIDSVKLISQKQVGMPRVERVVQDKETAKVQFSELNWKQAPFNIEAVYPNCYFEPIKIEFNSHFDGLDSSGNLPVLKLGHKVWSFAKMLGIELVDENGRHASNMVVTLIESVAIDEKKRKAKNERNRMTDKNGGVSFMDTYDWKNATIFIEEMGKEIKLDSPVLEITSGRDERIDIKIILREQKH